MSRAVFQQQYTEKQHTVALGKLVEISNNVILLMLHENRKKVSLPWEKTSRWDSLGA